MTSNGSWLRQFPGSPRLLMHPRAGRRARAVRTLAGASDWRRDVVDRLGGACVALLGPASPLSAAVQWPWPSSGHDEVEAELRRSLPGLQIVGAAVPRQATRRRLSLLCRYAGNPIVVKLGVDDPGTSLQTEARVLELLMDRPLPGIETPAVLAIGDLTAAELDEPMEFLATTAVGLGAQRPALDVELRTFETDLTDRLTPLGRPDPSLVAVHGDLTPWNLRRTRRGLALFDWESAGWGEPGSDIVHYRAACDEVRPWWSHRRST